MYCPYLDSPQLFASLIYTGPHKVKRQAGQRQLQCLHARQDTGQWLPVTRSTYLSAVHATTCNWDKTNQTSQTIQLIQVDYNVQTYQQF